MANHKATRKHARQSITRREHNHYYGKTTRNAISNLLNITEKEAAQEQFPKVVSMIDKLAKNNIIHKKKAANLKSRLSKKISTLA